MKKLIKRIIGSMLVVGYMIGGNGIAGLDLKAETTIPSSQVNVIDINQETSLFINSFTQDPTSGILILNCTIERPIGIPKEATHISLKKKIHFTIEDKTYSLGVLGADAPLKKVSATKAEVKIKGISIGDKAESDWDIELSKMKGKKVEVNMEGIDYVQQHTKISSSLAKQLKKVVTPKGVPFEQGNLYISYEDDLKGAQAKNDKLEIENLEFKKKYEAETRPINVLPKKGLNIPMVEGEVDCSVDNIGFVDGKLHMRLNQSKNVYLDLLISIAGQANIQNSKQVYTLKDQKNQEAYLVFEVKDLASLSKASFKILVNQTVATDEIVKTGIYVI